MNILALDTSMGACSAAIYCCALNQSGQLFFDFDERQRGHAEALMPMLKAVMSDAGLGFSELDRLAVTLGPGTFTGVRVGISAARGLAVATGLPIVGATSLEVMAQGYCVRGGESGALRPFVVAVDARRDQLYLQSFDVTGRAVSEAIASDIAEAPSHLPGDTGFAIGSGAALLADVVARGGKEIEVFAVDLQPNASDLAKMAAELPILDSVSPIYLRPPDAKPQIGKSIERAL